jgi:hypothetical protein
MAFSVEGDGLSRGRLHRFAVERFRVSILVTYTCRCAVRWPRGSRRRFAKRKRASRPTSIFLVNPSLFSTSPIERVGWCWLWIHCFGASQGQSWGQFRQATCPGPLRRNDLPSSTIHLAGSCPTRKERLLQEVRRRDGHSGICEVFWRVLNGSRICYSLRLSQEKLKRSGDFIVSPAWRAHLHQLPQRGER